jgi:peptide deformylase
LRKKPEKDRKTRPAPVEVEIPDEMRARWAERGDPVVRVPHEVLRQVAKPVEKPGAATRALVERMKAAMFEAHGVGLAAPQLGVSERVIIYKLAEEKEPLRVIVNPKIVSFKGEQVGPEGCLSIPLLQGDVDRAMEIEVRGLDMLGRPLKRRARDFEARVIQHEVDHLDGILFIDRADLATLHWLTDEDELDDFDDLEEDGSIKR